MSHWQSFIVGGAVRDRLLGQPVQDRDWVVVGASVEDMLAAGFTPVGKDFPVFLHPRTHEEYALARTERKTAPGYKGFVFHADREVRLEDDLIRRDLTINAMAEDGEGRLIDPYGGQRDLAAKIFRHVSPAFAEDPVRILRLARFAARYPEFSVAAETMQLMRDMVSAGEVDHLVAERVWQEISRGLMYVKPSRMIGILRDCGALARILPELEALLATAGYADVLESVDRAARRDHALPVRWAVLVRDAGRAGDMLSVATVEAICERLRVPADCRDLAVMLAREQHPVLQIGSLVAEEIAAVLGRCDVLRRPARFEGVLEASGCDASVVDGVVLANRWRHAMQAFCMVDAAVIAKAVSDKREIPARLNESRVAAVRQALFGGGAEGQVAGS